MRFAKTGPEWLTLIDPIKGDKEAPRGVRCKFAPLTRAMKRKAARAARELTQGIDLAAQLTDEQLDALFEAGEASTRVLIKLALLEQLEPEWDGVLDAKGKPLPVTAENVDLVLADDRFFDAADERFIAPMAERDAEKNGSSASLSGTGEAGTQGNDIASSSARPTTRTGGAKAAPTSRKRSSPRRGKGSGKS